MVDVVDTVTKERRSEIMGRVRAKDTRPEMTVRRMVHAMGYRYRLHREDLPGKPDLVLPRLHAVILVHGCFWHRHQGCDRTRTPKSRVDFWTRKFEDNVRRDQTVRRKLRRAGWSVLVIWECEAEQEEKLRRKIERFMDGVKDAIA